MISNITPRISVQAVFLLALLLITTHFISAQTGPWRGDYIFSSEADLFYVKIGEDIYSQDGPNWTRHGTIPSGLFNPGINSFEADANGNLYYISSQKIHKSEDKGVTWTVEDTEFWSSRMKVFNDTIYASSFENSAYAFYKRAVNSTDEWIRIPTSFTAMEDYLVAPDGELYVSEYLFKIHATTDNGQTWRVLGGDDFSFPNTAQVLALNDGELMAGLYFKGVWLYDEGTDSWSQSADGLPTNEVGEVKGVKSIEINSAGDIYVLVSDQIYCAGIYKSSDDGATYSEVPIPATHWYVHMLSTTSVGRGNHIGLAIDDDNVYINSRYYGFMSQQHGSGTWEIANNGRNQKVPHHVSRAREDSEGNVWVLMESPGLGPHDSWGVMKSSDNGDTWDHVDSLLNDYYYTLEDMMVTPNGTAFVSGYFPGTVHKSTDGGATWVTLDTIDIDGGNRSTISVLESGGSDEVIFAGTYISGNFRSTDAGETWTSLSMDGDSEVDVGALAIIVEDSSVWVLDASNDIWSSEDLGDTWTLVYEGELFLRDLVKAGDTLFARDFSNVYRSDDGGVNWTLISEATDMGAITGLTVITESTTGSRSSDVSYSLIVSSNRGIFTAGTTDTEVSLEVEGDYTGAFALSSGQLMVSQTEGVTTTDVTNGLDLVPPTISDFEVSHTHTNGTNPMTVAFYVGETLNENPTANLGEYAMTLDNVADNTYTFTYTFSDEPEGEYDIVMTATDDAGNKAIETYETSLVLDKTSPVASNYANSPGSISEVTLVEVSFTVDEELLEYPTVEINGNTLTHISNDDYTFNYEYEFQPGIEGYADAIITMIDLAENEGETVITDALYFENVLPGFTSGSEFSVAENSTNEIVNVEANSPGSNADDGITYSLSGDDASLFNIDASGSLTFVSSPDYENPQDADSDNVYLVVVNAANSIGTSTQELTITVLNLNDNAPSITSSNSISIDENTTFVMILTATDIDGSEVSFGLSGGMDIDNFSLDGSDLSLVSGEDFESPSDQDSDNVYVVEIEASDGENASTQTISVTVNNVNDNAPEITSQTEVNVESGSTDVMVLEASDADGSQVSFSLVGGDDIGLLQISGEQLQFINAPDFENPSDANGDNIYEVEIMVSDGDFESAVSINITVSAILSTDYWTSLKLFPNPASEVLRVSGLQEKVVDFLILDISGKEIMNNVLIGETADIDISRLDNGIYIIQLRFDQILYETKFIKE
ncbi:MAG: T9SS type A sorting domain-containing protein [bacterium]|nr:T9SS type A sorting domain-containing protein [bacterium]